MSVVRRAEVPGIFTIYRYSAVLVPVPVPGTLYSTSTVQSAVVPRDQ